MSNKKQFGVWMDSHQAVIVGREDVDNGNFVVLGHAEGSADNTKMFKDITSLMQNAEEIHVTGTGDYQEQFIHQLAATPQFKNAVAKESTSNKMSDEKLLEYITARFN
jgi:hypothetical protein